MRVNRNAGAPTFVPAIYTPGQIIEHFQTGSDIVQINLVDPDGDEVEMYVDSTRPKSDYFHMSGNRLQLLKPLSGDPDRLTMQTYTVIIKGNDIGNPNNPATNTATVTLSVDRNDFPPEFIAAPYSGSVTRSTGNGTVVTTASWRDQDLTSPYGDVTVEVVGASAGYATDIFRLSNVIGNTGNIIVYNDQLLAADDAEEYTVSFRSEIFLNTTGYL